MNNLREAKSALGGKLNQMEMQLKSSTQAETQHLKEITKLRNQLKEENKVKIVSLPFFGAHLNERRSSQRIITSYGS